MNRNVLVPFAAKHFKSNRRRTQRKNHAENRSAFTHTTCMISFNKFGSYSLNQFDVIQGLLRTNIKLQTLNFNLSLCLCGKKKKLSLSQRYKANLILYRQGKDKRRRLTIKISIVPIRIKRLASDFQLISDAMNRMNIHSRLILQYLS